MAYVPELESPNKKAGLSKHTAVSVSLLHTHTPPTLGDSHSSKINVVKMALKPRKKFS